ncbi:MAG: class I SAM-dependent methyltransferase [Bdellovibrionota bacterium]|nr:MAG: class I SAM-dependent methyltransferase [Bdellovibrionota bacterium]
MAKVTSPTDQNSRSHGDRGETGYGHDLAFEFISSIDQRPSREIVLKPTVRHYLSEIGIAGKAAVDLACGNGDFTRLLAEMGVGSVLGVDASRDLLTDASKRSGHGIAYREADLAVAQNLGQFDVAIGIFFLHYARSVDELRTMIRNVSVSLRPGASFLAAVNNPFSPLRPPGKFDRAIVPEVQDKPLEEGDRLQVIKMRAGTVQTKVTIHYYPPERYVQLLKEAGFDEIEWLPLRVDRAKVPQGQEQHWNDYVDENEPAILRCKLREAV